MSDEIGPSARMLVEPSSIQDRIEGIKQIVREVLAEEGLIGEFKSPRPGHEITTRKWCGTSEKIGGLASKMPSPFAEVPEKNKYRVFRHYKGDLYQYIDTAFCANTTVPHVIYKSMETGQVWIRPSSEFYGEVSPGRQRFAQLKDT